MQINEWGVHTNRKKRAELPRPLPLLLLLILLLLLLGHKKEVLTKFVVVVVVDGTCIRPDSDCDSLDPFSGGPHPPWVFCCSNCRCNCYCYQLCMQFIFKEIIALPHVGQLSSARFGLVWVACDYANISRPSVRVVRCFCSFRPAFLYNNKERQVKEWPVFAYNLIWIWISHTQCSSESGTAFDHHCHPLIFLHTLPPHTFRINQ